MEQFHLKENYTIEDINALIEACAEESTYLEFKKATSLNKGDKERKEIAKDISAMANADGGVIIYGVDEVDHKASGISFVDGREFTKEWIEQIVMSNTQRPLRSFKVIPIRVDHKIEQSVYIVRIQFSPEAPHMANGKYYKRANFEVFTMQEYEVRNLYNLRHKTELEILGLFDIDCKPGLGKFNSFAFRPEIRIKNISNSIEFNYKMEVLVPMQYPLSSPSEINKFHNGNDGYYKVHTIPNKDPLFQGEVRTYASYMVIPLNREKLDSFLNLSMIIKLYYSNGVIQKEYKFSEYFTINGQPVTIDNFL
ncbi:MAG: hypothetical protein CVU05_06350 [Bacteroidetes bacterium HGW-Bacteroidetes-21]|nr:MAG: hypothetical protein CVU05_06350 [Bacteroidetes bacterium HGW-Bacteroidetes-21]